MKNIKLFAITAIAVVMAASCEPVLIKGPEPGAAVTVAELDAGLTFAQYADKDATIPQADGNYIKFESTAGIVSFFNYKADGSENILGAGAAGVFALIPKRGQDPNQTLHYRMINQDGTIIESQRQMTVFVPADLDPSVKILTGDTGEKAWKWNAFDGACWGNAGYIGVGDQGDVAHGEVPGKWWGCVPEDLETEQIQHSGGVAYGYGSSNAYMVFNEDGECMSFNENGDLIAKGSYSLNNYDPECSDGYLYGTLETTDAPILMPFAINTDGKRVNTFEVIYIDPNNMTLINNDAGNDVWSWGECTWWRFKQASDPDEALAGAGQRAWTYYAINGSTWGNAGYIGVGGQANVAAGEIPGFWWGCVAEDLDTERIGVSSGYASSDAFMVFDSEMGTVTSYSPDGEKIASSPYEVVDFDWKGDYKMGDLVTGESGSGLLYPFAINTGGAVNTTYEILYIDGGLMTLIGNYNGEGEWSWGECTWWRFQPAK